LVLPTVVTWVYFIALDGAAAVLQQTAYGVGKAIQFSLPVIWVFLVRRERLNLTAPNSRGFLAGGAFGLLVAAGIVGLYFLALKPAGMLAGPAEAVRAKVQSFGAGPPAAFILLGLFYSAIHSLLEEYYWRWFVFGQLAERIALSPAIVISAFAFAAHHVLVLEHYFGWTSLWTWLFTASVVVGGAVWATLYRYSGSLYAPWLSHGLVDAAIFVIGYDMLRP
jgi:membrane protease YdiL (CAAX protease family)